MNERERIEALLREMAADPSEVDRFLELLNAAYDGLEEGLSSGVCDGVKQRLDETLAELENTANALEETIRA